jgi:hypothetical protein
MPELVRFPLEGVGSVLIEVKPEPAPERTAGRRGAAKGHSPSNGSSPGAGRGRR